MTIASTQSQIKKLQDQIKFSTSPKQTKMFEGAIARLEEKLKADVEAQPKIVKTVSKKEKTQAKPSEQNS